MRRWGVLIVIALATALAAGGCTGGSSDAATTSSKTPTDPTSGPTEGSDTPTSAPASRTIPQPDVGDLQVAPERERVDLVMPTFSDPTNVTNPLFPVSKQESVLLLGRVDGKAFRTEVTLLPETRIIEWEGQLVEVLVSQYVAYLDGRLHEVAYDLYAQDDTGAVWYFGEDVFNFGNGAIVDTHGTWIAGKDGPAAMIMPADPQVGDVYRPENIPGFVFEEVTVKSVGQTLDGPFGPIDGGLVIEELHMDGTVEGKTFAPGYGEFYTSGGGDTEALALAVPTDAASEPTPAELTTLFTGAMAVFDASGSGDWDAASATVAEMSAAWERFRTGEVPELIEPRMTDALRSLARAVDAHSTRGARQEAIDTAQQSLDLELRHRPAAGVDVARFDLWLAQMLLDAAGGDADAVNGDFFSLDYIRDRIVQVLDPADVVRVNLQLEELLGAIGDEDFAAVSDTADQLRATLADAASGS